MTEFHIDYTDQAIINLADIGDYIGLDNPERADSFIDEIVEFIDATLSRFPYAASAKFPAYPSIRLLPYRRYNIYYQVIDNDPDEEKIVEILFIHNSAKLSPYEKDQ